MKDTFLEQFNQDTAQENSKSLEDFDKGENPEDYIERLKNLEQNELFSEYLRVLDQLIQSYELFHLDTLDNDVFTALDKHAHCKAEMKIKFTANQLTYITGRKLTIFQKYTFKPPKEKEDSYKEARKRATNKRQALENLVQKLGDILNKGKIQNIINDL